MLVAAGSMHTRQASSRLSRARSARDKRVLSSRAVPVARAYTRQMAKVHTRQEGYSVVVSPSYKESFSLEDIGVVIGLQMCILTF